MPVHADARQNTALHNLTVNLANVINIHGIWQKYTIKNLKQEAQLMLANPRDTFRGQSRSPNMAPFHILGMVSYQCSITAVAPVIVFTDSLKHADGQHWIISSVCLFIWHSKHNINEKSAQRRRKHCALAVVRRNQIFSPRCRPPSRRRGTAKI